MTKRQQGTELTNKQVGAEILTRSEIILTVLTVYMMPVNQSVVSNWSLNKILKWQEGLGTCSRILR